METKPTCEQWFFLVSKYNRISETVLIWLVLFLSTVDVFNLISKTQMNWFISWWICLEYLKVQKGKLKGNRMALLQNAKQSNDDLVWTVTSFRLHQSAFPCLKPQTISLNEVLLALEVDIRQYSVENLNILLVRFVGLISSRYPLKLLLYY